MKKNTRKLKLDATTLKYLNETTLRGIAGGATDGPSVDGGASGCGCGNSWQGTCHRTQ